LTNCNSHIFKIAEASNLINVISTFIKLDASAILKI